MGCAKYVYLKYTFYWSGAKYQKIQNNININKLNDYNVRSSHFSVAKSIRRQKNKLLIIQCALPIILWANSIRIVGNITSFIYAHLHINLYTVYKIIYWQNSQLLTFEQQYSTFALAKLTVLLSKECLISS